MLESQLRPLVLARLNALPGVCVWRSNRGKSRTPAGRMITFGQPGAADIQGIVAPGHSLWIELKRDERDKPTVDQVTFARRVRAMGATYILAWSLDMVLVGVAPLLAAAERAEREGLAL